MRRLSSSFVLCLLALSVLSGCGGGKGGDPPAGNGAVRTYYIAAEDLPWDYAPSGVNQITGVPFANYTGANADPNVVTMTRRIAFDPISSASNPTNFTNDPAAVQVGTLYRKSLFVEYTSASFTVKKPREAKWRHLGVLGPIIRAEVGDTIRVVFKNKTGTARSFSLHPHGVFYTKPSEGAPYVSNGPASFSAGNNVAPGESFAYEWPVPERAGPGPSDGESIGWMYHSHVDEPKDVNTGLVGPMIIYRKGALRPDGTVVGIDREFVADFEIFDESSSWHFEQNLKDFGKLSDLEIATLLADPEFEPEPHLKHSINGYIFGNLPLDALTMKKGETVRWYLMAMGTEVDLHTPHWHGNTVLVAGMRVDTVGLLPALMVTADMTPDNPGIWLFHCHVGDHINAGMIARYQVTP